MKRKSFRRVLGILALVSFGWTAGPAQAQKTNADRIRSLEEELNKLKAEEIELKRTPLRRPSHADVYLPARQRTVDRGGG